MSSQPTSHWGSLIAATTAAVVVGFASTILVVIEGVRAVGASPAQQASVAASLCFAMAVTTLILSLWHRQPLLTAWSTPGAVLLATGAAGTSFPQAIGAFIFAGVLMMLTALIKPLSSDINRMPAAIAAAMLAGVLLRYCLGVPGAALAMPTLVVPLVLAFFALRMLVPMYTVPVIVVLGLLFAVLGGGFNRSIPFGMTPLTLDLPEWNLQAMLGIGVPLYLVTMASQNLPGFAVLRANGYEPPVSACLLVTGLASVVMAPFGTHAVNMAAITAALVAGPEAHPDSKQRWKMAYAYLVLYGAFGLAAGTFVALLTAIPKELVTAIAGLALFAPLMGGIAAMTREAKDIEAALVTFLVTASGISILGVGAAFWGLLAGLLVWAGKRMQRR